MEKELTFRNLPFEPVKGQVIYFESSYNNQLNVFIQNNYEWLLKTFINQGLEFCYLPRLSGEAVGYYAPYLSEEEISKKFTNLPLLTDFIIDEGAIEPSLVFAIDIPVKDKEGNTILQSVRIPVESYVSLKSAFTDIIEEIHQVACKQNRYYLERELRQLGKDADGINRYNSDSICFSISRSKDMSSDSKGPDEADSNFDSQSQILIKEIKERIDALRNRGVNTMFLHQVIDEGERLSRLRITKDFRIYLMDYDNMEIKLPILPKSVYLLFLRHPEGIRFKELTDYYSELLQIYLKMSPIGGRSKQEQSIRDVTDPCSNSINEKCARIREAFVSNFDDRLARKYYITGKRGEVKRIMLDESLIIWD